MADLGKQGGKAASPRTDPREAGTPKTGFDSAPGNQWQTFHAPQGHGGSNPGAR